MGTCRNAVNGLLAGAAGSAILDTVTYADMLLRGRAPSSLPEHVVAKLAALAGYEVFARPDESLGAETKNRRAALAALIGYLDGFGSGVALGLIRPLVPRLPRVVVASFLAALTLVVSEGTATALGQTDPREWSPGDWLSDIVPRFAYGWAACLAFDRMNGDR